jgi:hypothetical protein
MSTSNPVENVVYAFACSVAGRPEWRETIYNTTTRGKAKREHHSHVTEPWPDIAFTAIRCRKVGPAHTSADFRRVAEYRGLPAVRCGQPVTVGDASGTIVGHNSNANFNVLFHTGRWAGQTLNVHPSELRL